MTLYLEKNNKRRIKELQVQKQPQQQEQLQQQLRQHKLVPNQKVILNRCLGDCKQDEISCIPSKRRDKYISAIFKLNKMQEEEEKEEEEKKVEDYKKIFNALINGTLSKTKYIILKFPVEEHVHCFCHAPECLTI